MSDFKAMSDNPTPRKMMDKLGFQHTEISCCAEMGCTPVESPAPRISEEEIQRVAVEITAGIRAGFLSIFRTDAQLNEEITAILRTPYESRKA